jgi:hypothetical protein
MSCCERARRRRGPKLFFRRAQRPTLGRERDVTGITPQIFLALADSGWQVREGVVSARQTERPQAAVPWHFLYFLPEPQGQGSLRPTLAPERTGLGGSACAGPA